MPVADLAQNALSFAIHKFRSEIRAMLHGIHGQQEGQCMEALRSILQSARRVEALISEAADLKTVSRSDWTCQGPAPVRCKRPAAGLRRESGFKRFPCLKRAQKELQALAFDDLDEEARKHAFDLIAQSVGEILPIKRLRNDHCVWVVVVMTIIQALEEQHVSDCCGTYCKDVEGLAQDCIARVRKVLEEIKLCQSGHDADGAKHIPDDHRADVVALEAHSNGGEQGSVQQQETGFIIALQEALAGNNSSCARVSELIEGKADVNQTYDDPQGGPQSVLTMAVLCNNAILTKMLCEAKADVASQVGEYPSPVRLAYERGLQACLLVLASVPKCYWAPDITLEIVKMLVEAQTDINWADVNGQTALHYHAGAGRFEAASCLIKFNAMIDKKDVEGKAPIHMVEEATHEWLLLLGFVRLITLVGHELILPISELTLQDFAHSVRAFVQDHYKKKGERVSYFTIGVLVGSLGHA